MFGPRRILKSSELPVLFTVSFCPADLPMKILFEAFGALDPAKGPKKFEEDASVALDPAKGPKKFEEDALVALYPV